ncbi:MAG: hypothetical protein M1444_03140 [Patescibacteria group bacterium]|nr:hypothetical protein [Patescibacteria group bacterium]
MLTNQVIDEWKEKAAKKYEGKIFTPNQIDQLRDELVEKFGNKVIPGMAEKLTDKETLARVEYEILSESLYKLAPDVEKADKMMLDAIKVQLARDKLFKILKKAAIVILFILLFLALIKYLIS